MKGKMSKIRTSVLFLSLSACVFAAWDQARLERDLHAYEPEDCIPDDDPGIRVYLRQQDALAEYSEYMTDGGWTTNQFITGLIQAFTNYTTTAMWADRDNRRIARAAIWKLCKINHPMVTNFFRQCNEVDSIRYKGTTIRGMFRYTNLEPEVLDYMRTLCVRTNIYDRVADLVMHDMFDTLESMSSEMKPAATNRVARYMYFAIHHVTDSQGWQDRELATFIPAYSNSVQRLDLMRYVSTSATNSWERANASNVVERLSSMPSNQLNNVEWIAE